MDISGIVMTVLIKAAKNPTSESTLKPDTFPTQATSVSFVRRFQKPKILLESISQHTTSRNIEYKSHIDVLN